MLFRSREIIKTAIENNQNLTVEGCYVPFDWKKDFDAKYLENIKSCCIVMTENYIRNNFDSIVKYANAVEKRLFDSVDMEEFIAENKLNLSLCEKYGENVILIDDEYKVDIIL